MELIMLVNSLYNKLQKSELSTLTTLWYINSTQNYNDCRLTCPGAGQVEGVYVLSLAGSVRPLGLHPDRLSWPPGQVVTVSSVSVRHPHKIPELSDTVGGIVCRGVQGLSRETILHNQRSVEP